MKESLNFAMCRLIRTLALGCALVLVVLGVPTLYGMAPDIETRAFPVVREFRIEKAEWIDRFRLRIFVRFYKSRPCRFIEQNWYLLHEYKAGDGRQLISRERIMIEFADRIDGEHTWSRPSGDNRAGPWILHISPDADERSHFTLIRHDCGLPWDTASEAGPIDMTEILTQRPR